MTLNECFEKDNTGTYSSLFMDLVPPENLEITRKTLMNMLFFVADTIEEQNTNESRVLSALLDDTVSLIKTIKQVNDCIEYHPSKRE